MIMNRIMNRKNNLPCFIALLLFGMVPLTTFAADEEEVIVSARKTDESLQDTPLTISVLGSSDFEKLNIKTIDDFSKFVPGLSFSNAFGRATERPVVRGLSNVLAGVQFGVESGASYFINGSYYPGDIQSLDLNLVQRVEVVKGPQSALYGRNTYSGAINFVLKNPSFDKFSGVFKASTANNEESSSSINLSIPVSDTTAITVSGRSFDYGGEWRNQVTNRIIGDQSSTNYSFGVVHDDGDGISVSYNFIRTEDRDGTRPFALLYASNANCPINTAGAADSAVGTPFSHAYCGALPADLPINLNDGSDFDGIQNNYAGVVSPTANPLVSSLVPGTGGITSGIFNFFASPSLTSSAVPFSGVDRGVNLHMLNLNFTVGDGADLSISRTGKREELLTGSDSDHSAQNVQFIPRTVNLDSAGRVVTTGGTPTSFLGPVNHTGRSSLGTADLVQSVDDVTEIRFQSNKDAEDGIKWIVGIYEYSRNSTVRDLPFTSAPTSNVRIFECRNSATGALANGCTEPGNNVFTAFNPLFAPPGAHLVAVDYYSAGDRDVTRRESIHNAATFGFVEFDFDEFLFSIELRDQRETRVLQVYQATDGDTIIEADDYQGTIDFTGRRVFNDLLPRLTFTYRPDDENNLYFVYSEGIKTGGFNVDPGSNVSSANLAATPELITYDPETSVNIEIGYKGVFDDGDTSFSVAYYQNSLSDIQVSVPIGALVATSTSVTSIVSNVAEGISTGFEIELLTAISDTFSIGFNYAFTDATFDGGTDATVARIAFNQGFVPSSDTDCNTASLVRRVPVCLDRYGSIDGNQFAFSPENTWSLRLQYDETFNSELRIAYDINFSYEDRKFTQLDNLQYVPEVMLVNTRLTFGLDDNSVRLAVYGVNILDETSPILATRWIDTNNFGARGRSYFITPRRGASYGVEVAVDF